MSAQLSRTYGHLRNGFDRTASPAAAQRAIQGSGDPRVHAPWWGINGRGGAGTQLEREHAEQVGDRRGTCVVPQDQAQDKPKTEPPLRKAPMPGPTFVPLALPAATVEGDIRIELQRGGTTVAVVWHCQCCSRLRRLAERLASMIRVEAVWLCVEPLDMRAGTDATAYSGHP